MPARATQLAFAFPELRHTWEPPAPEPAATPAPVEITPPAPPEPPTVR